MSKSADDGRDSAEGLLAEFMELRSEDPSLTFETWLQPHRLRADELRELYSALRAVEGQLPAPETSELNLESGYEIVRELGRGAYGRVFRAKDIALGRDVALKVLGDEARVSLAMRRRFLEEARVLARLDHPNIVRIHSIDDDAGEIRLSLELVEGRTLKEAVDADGPYSATEAARIGIDLCRALSVIHGQGLVHMDIKPGNAMRAAGGRIVLLDFGLARPTENGVVGPTEPIGGTPPFMSPEHFEGGARIGPASDLYSLGVLLYWIVSGQFPTESADFSSLRDDVLAGRVAPLVDRRPDIDPRFVAVVEKAMARRESQRFSSAGAMERALREVLEPAGSSAPAVALDAVPSSRRRGLQLVALLALLAVLAIGAWAVRPTRAAQPFEPTVQLFRIGRAGDTQLRDEARLQLEDRLYLTARGDETFHLYVFSEDSNGDCYTLWPKTEDHAPLPGDQVHRLPGFLPEDCWEVTTSGGGSEHFLIVAAAGPDRFAESLRKWIPRPELAPPLRVADLSHAARDTIFRGIELERATSLDPAAGQTLVELFDLYAQTLGPDSRVVVDRIRLENP